MSLNDFLLLCAALFPAIALCVYVFKKDRVEKEPIGLLIGLFLLGAVACFPAAEIETGLFNCIKEIFTPFAVEFEDGLYLIGTSYKAFNLTTNFIGIALVEEGLKLLILLIFTRKNKNFNSLFDGLIYSVFVSLGFAAFENVLYVLENGWLNALMRAVMSVPGHMFFAVLMGYYYSLWHVQIKAKTMEKNLKRDGVIIHDVPNFSSTGYLILSLLIPVLAHGWYDYCCTVDSIWYTILLFAFLIFLYVYCFKKVNKMSKADANDNLYSIALLIKKYPYLVEFFYGETNVAEENNI